MKVLGAIVLICLASAAAAAEAPRRIVSMNLCTDQMVLRLAEPGTVLSVSFLTADPEESPVASQAQALPLNTGQAEEVIALNPDLVVTGRFTTTAAKLLLRRLGYSVLEVDVPLTFDGVRDTYQALGAALHREAQAQALIADLDQRIGALDRRARGGSYGTVLILDANGFTVGRPSLVDEVLTRIGLTNVAAALDIGDFGQVSLEAVLLAKPDHIVRMAYRVDAPSLANLTLSHPALASYLDDRPMIDVPQSWLNCGGPMLADAAERVLNAVTPQEAAYKR